MWVECTDTVDVVLHLSWYSAFWLPLLNWDVYIPGCNQECPQIDVRGLLPGDMYTQIR